MFQVNKKHLIILGIIVIALIIFSSLLIAVDIPDIANRFDSATKTARGASLISSILISEEEQSAMRRDIDMTFSSMYLGVDYWVDAMCYKKLGSAGSNSILLDTPSGLALLQGNINAAKTPITGFNESTNSTFTFYIYRISFYVNPPEYDQFSGGYYQNLAFDVYIYGDRTVMLYSSTAKTKSSSTSQTMKKVDYSLKKQVVQESNFNYDKVCIVFKEPVVTAGHREVKQLCSSIKEYGGSGTSYQSPDKSPTGGDLNDF